MQTDRKLLKTFLSKLSFLFQFAAFRRDTGRASDPVGSLIRNAYRLILEREPDTDGFGFYHEKITSGKITKNYFIRSLVYSQEFELRFAGLPLHELFGRRDQAGESGLFKGFVQKDPFTGEQINELANPYKWLNPEWRRFGDDLRVVPMSLPLMHRKTFEWIQTIYGLSCIGKLSEKSKVLGVGTGHEPIVYWLALHSKEVVATDLFDEDWARGNAEEGDPEVLCCPEKYKPFDYPEERLKFMRMDGRSLEFDDNSFDIVFSLSSIEHFGGKEMSAKAVKEMARVLKSGGIAVLATEYVLNSMKHPFFFNQDDLIDYLIRGSGFKLIQNIDFSVPSIYFDKALKFPDEIYNSPHMSLTDGSVVWTSIVLFLIRE